MFKVTGTAKGQNVNECLSRWFLLNHRIFSYQTWYGYAISWAWVSCWKICFMVRARAHTFKIWSADFLLTKLGLIINKNVMSKTTPAKKDSSIHGQGHGKGSECQCLSGWYLLYCQNILLPKSQDVRKDPSATRLSLMIHDHKLEHLMKKLYHCVQCQGYSKISKCQ